MKTNKYHFRFLPIIFLALSVSSYSQSTHFIVEYSPNISNYSNLSSTDSKPKLSHNTVLTIDIPISTSLSLSPGMSYYNVGYKYFSESSSISSGGVITFNKRTEIFNYNYLVLNIGSRFRHKKYFVSPNFGFGFQTESSIKSITKHEDGEKKVSKNRFKAKKLKISMFPFSLAIGRELALYRYDVILGIKGYYVFFKDGSNQDRAINAYGIGLLFGIQLD